mmetsp:Transcript_37088/g.89010  ORF Transcript_37088/g.89010 Transcript_37088/m.89010 type:complete len:413 (-) Transcript_37088:1974-3212(-)
MVLDEELLEHVARLDVVDNVLGHLELGVARELLHRVRLVGEVGLAREELEEDEAEAPHVERARRAHAVGLLAQHGARELGRAVARRDLHRDGLARLPRALQIDDLPAQTEEHEIVRLDVTVHDVVGVQVLHDVRQPVDDELALIALQRALLQVVGKRERAVLEHHAVLLIVRVLIVVNELDDVLGAKLLEEGDLAHEVLLDAHELERDASLRLHVERELDEVESAHGGALLELVPALVEVRSRVLARAHAAHRSDGRRELLARPERGDAHLAQVGGSELDQCVEVELLPNKDARVLAQAKPLQPRDEFVALVAAAPRATAAPPPPAQVTVVFVLVHDARVEGVEVGAAAEAAEGVHLRACDGGGVAVAGEGRHARHVGLGPRERVRVEHVDLVVGRDAPQPGRHAAAVPGNG